MGAGTSTEQVADKPTEEEVEQCVDLGEQEQEGQEVEVNAAGDAKLLHTNGKIAIINGAADGEDGVVEGLQASDVNGHGLDEIIAVVKEVEQQEPSSVILNEEPTENMGVVQNDTTTKEATKEDGQAQTPETTETTPESEEKAESPDQANENQSNEVGFKKVFKFVGLKFTVKKEKTEKSEPVQLLTVKKDEVEINGTDNHEEHTDTVDAGNPEIQQETKDSGQPAESTDKPEKAAEGPNGTPEENQKKVEESEVEKDQKSPESPTNPVVAETSSPFRRFFTQGWAGLRKKTSFKKSKEEDPQEVEKHIKVKEQEKAEVPEAVKEENITETHPKEEDESVAQELSKSSSDDSKVSTEENDTAAEEKPKEEEPSPVSVAEVKLEEGAKVDMEVVPVGEITEHVAEIATSVPEATALPPEVKDEVDTLEANVETQITDEIAAPSSPAAEVIIEDLQVTSVSVTLDNDQPQLTSSTEYGDLEKSQEAITTEAELLSSQEKAKIQGSPLKKLFSSSGLRKLSGKKSKSKKDDDSKVEATTEAVSSESPEAPEVDGGDSSPSSPDESAETSPTEKPTDDVQAAGAEGEGATSDGERKKDGITPWASFKKLVTPKRRPKRPSESDKEDEVEKAKSSTMSSTESAGTVENQEEPKETNEEQKLEKSTEESKKKVDSSVSWEALICVGSSKKRSRKTSDSDEDEGIKSQDETKKIEETVPAKETDSESPITSSQEQQIQESTSPDQAGSPTEADGASTWQSFKRLVTPRRKSRTRVEEKTDETVTAANAEQSTSEGETGKEETWVSLKKLIPGRKKKKSDGKQEHAPITENGQPLNEAVEDDSDEPAVVPLSEFDAAEQEKLDAQKSLEEALLSVLGEQEEKANEELIHAVTVTVIEGERAITSLEERSPSWISATVSETIEQAKQTEEATEIIKAEVTVEETVVLSTASQVMTEIPNKIINEMELTSEALTALEEAIENSCTEETTEMISAVSQLGESVFSTEEATPVPEEDASLKTLEDQKKHTDSILYEAAQKAKLTIDTLQLQASQHVTAEHVSTSDLQTSVETNEVVCQSAPLCAEEQTDLTPVCLEDQDDKFTIVSAEETVEEICISVIEKTRESIVTSEIVQNEVNAPLVNLDQMVETVTICVSALTLKGEEAEQSSTMMSAVENEGDLTNLSEYQVVKETPTCNEAIDVTLKTEEKGEDASDSVVIESMVKENIPSLETVRANDLPPVEDVKTIEAVISSSEVKESVLALVEVHKAVKLDTVQIADGLPASSELQTKEVVPVPSELQPEEAVLVLSELQPEETILVSSEIQPEEDVLILRELLSLEAVPLSSEIQPEEVVLVSSELQPEETVLVSSEIQPEEDVLILRELLPLEAVPVSSEIQSEEATCVSSEIQPEESLTVATELQAEEIVLVASEVKQEEAVPVSSAEQPEDVATESSVVQPKEAITESSEVQTEEFISVISEVQSKDESVSCEVQVEEAVSVSKEFQPEETVPISSEKQPEEIASVSDEVKKEECVSLLNEVQAEKGVSASNELQREVGSVSSEVKNEDIPFSEVQMSEEVSICDDKQVEEGVTVPAALQVEQSVPVSDEAQVKDGASMLAKVKFGESTSVVAEVDSEKVTPESVEVQAEESATVASDVQADHNMQADEASYLPVDEEVEEISIAIAVVQIEDSTPVSSNVQTEQDFPLSGEMQAEESSPEPVQAEEGIQESDKVQSIEVSPVVIAKEIVHVGNWVSVLDDKQTEVGSDVATEEHPKEIALVQSEVSEVQAEEVTASVEILDEHTEEAPSVHEVKNVENDAQKSEVALGSIENKEICSDDQTQRQPAEDTKAVTDVLIADQETTALQSENSHINSNHIELKDMSPSAAQEGANESEVEIKEDKITHSQEEIVEMKEEEVVTTDIPELESSEAVKASEPVTAAAVEEQVLAETVQTIEVSKDSIEPSEEICDDKRSEDNEVLSKVLEVVVESVSHKAAAIVDAAIEAATNCFVVNATSQGETLEETTVSKKVELIEETETKTVTIESCSTTIVQSIIETSVETIVSNIHINETVIVQEKNLEHELDSQLQETVSVTEPIKSCPQLEDSEQAMTEGVQNTGREMESSVPAHTQEKNEHQESTQASEVNAQEKTPTIES